MGKKTPKKEMDNRSFLDRHMADFLKLHFKEKKGGVSVLDNRFKGKFPIFIMMFPYNKVKNFCLFVCTE